MRVAVIEGFVRPESVRYDPDQDVYFVSNFNVTVAGVQLDNNGFISRVSPDGSVQQLKFIEGGVNGVTLHAPKGLAIVGDTLWAVDVDAIRGFDRRTGAPIGSVDIAQLGAGLANDAGAGPAGDVYVTDSNQHRIYRVSGGIATIALQDSTLNRPNGITWDPYRERFVLAPLGGKRVIQAWQPGQTRVEEIATSPGGAFDGIEVIGRDRFLITSQSDSTVQLVTGATASRLFRVEGSPADLGVDTRRNRVALPFLGLNRVEIWQLRR